MHGGSQTAQPLFRDPVYLTCAEIRTSFFFRAAPQVAVFSSLDDAFLPCCFLPPRLVYVSLFIFSSILTAKDWIILESCFIVSNDGSPARNLFE